MKVGETMLVRRVLHGDKPPKGYTHRLTALASHHGRHSTHAVRIVKRKAKAKRGRK